MRYVLAVAGGFQQITDLSSSTALTLPTAPAPKGCLVQAEAQNVRYRTDGTAPTAGIGLILYAGDPPTVLSEANGFTAEGLALLRFIEAAPSAKLNVVYFV